MSNALHVKTGVLGESLAAQHLIARGHRVIERNYRQKWGEIDIISKADNRIHFVEVKAVSYETKNDLKHGLRDDSWRPEEQVHARKQRRLARAIETWLAESKYQGDWQIDVITLRLVPRERFAVINVLDNILFE